MKTKVRGSLPRDFMLGLEEVENIINNRVVPITSSAMRKDHHFAIDGKGRITFYPTLDTEDPMSFTTTLNALIEDEMECGPEAADGLIKVLKSAIWRVNRAKRMAK